MDRILDKTDKGREEIATRKYRLALRLRTLLLLIDGKHTAEEILKQVSALGLNEQSVNELLDNGFVQAIAGGVLTESSATMPASAVEITTPEASSEDGTPGDGSILPEGETQFQALYHFYTSTIKSTVGLRGYALQLKVERAGSIEDFRDLRQAYLDAVLKANGPEMMRSLRDRLDQLLYLGHPPVDLNTKPLV